MKNQLITWNQSGPLYFSGRINGKEVFWTTVESYGVELLTTLTGAVGENWTDCGGALALLLCKSQEEAQVKSEEAFTKWLESMGLVTAAEHEADLDILNKGLTDVAKALGVTSPLELIVMAENNEERYTDLLVKWINKSNEKNAHHHRCDTCQKWLDEVCP